MPPFLEVRDAVLPPATRRCPYPTGEKRNPNGAPCAPCAPSAERRAGCGASRRLRYRRRPERGWIWGRGTRSRAHRGNGPDVKRVSASDAPGACVDEQRRLYVALQPSAQEGVNLRRHAGDAARERELRPHQHDPRRARRSPPFAPRPEVRSLGVKRVALEQETNPLERRLASAPRAGFHPGGGRFASVRRQREAKAVQAP